MQDKIPNVFITTSRSPTINLIKFTKELKHLFSKSQILNRGLKFLPALIDICLIFNGTDILLLHENRGAPNGIVISHLPKGPTAFFSIKNVIFSVRKKRISFSSKAPNIIFDNLNSPVGKKLSLILRSLFSCPNQNSKRVITFSGNGNQILFRHHLFEKSFEKSFKLKLHELGPSFDMFPYKITLSHLAENNT